MSVKQLIRELEKIDNKFLEVECLVPDNRYRTLEIARVQKQDKKVLITTKDYSDVDF